VRRWIDEPKTAWLSSPFAGASLKHGPHMVSNYKSNYQGMPRYP